MKYFFVIITLTGLLLQTFGKGLIWAEYMLNKDYIARELCVNRAKPRLACNGQCHLMKQMAKETQKEQTGNTAKDKYEVIFSEINRQPALYPPYIIIKRLAAYDQNIPHQPVHTIFHPPRA